MCVPMFLHFWNIIAWPVLGFAILYTENIWVWDQKMSIRQQLRISAFESTYLNIFKNLKRDTFGHPLF